MVSAERWYRFVDSLVCFVWKCDRLTFRSGLVFVFLTIKDGAALQTSHP